MRVLVIEAKDDIGGMTTTRDLVTPGFATDVHARGYQLASYPRRPGNSIWRALVSN
jgi:phytoene dehydrogenase-like protein